MADIDIEEWINRYVETWASREPHIMARMWHEDGVLHHPALDAAIAGSLVPLNNDNTKAMIPDLEWSLRNWAVRADVVFLEWSNTGTYDGRRFEWGGVDRMVLRGDRITEETVFFDTYPLRRLVDPSLPDLPLVRADDLKREGP